MNHFALNPHLRKKKQQAIRDKLKPIARLFFFSCLIPLIAYVFATLFPATTPSEFEELEKATALVSTFDGTGTAFLVSDNKLLTARHVVEGLELGEKLDLVFENINPIISTTATLLWRDNTNYEEELNVDYFTTDVAVLELDDPEAIRDVLPLALGDSDLIVNLTPIVTIGYPKGDYSITRGDINNTEMEGFDLFKLDAATNHGNSGGPVISIEEKVVIGMLVGGRGGQNIQGENVANKINNILRLIENAGIDLE